MTPNLYFFYDSTQNVINLHVLKIKPPQTVHTRKIFKEGFKTFSKYFKVCLNDLTQQV